MLCLRSAKLGSTDLMASHTRSLLPSETTVAVRTSWLPSTLSGWTCAPSTSRVCKTGWYFCLSCSRSAMEYSPSDSCGQDAASALQPAGSNLQSHHLFERRRLSDCQNRGANLSGREHEVGQTVKTLSESGRRER